MRLRRLVLALTLASLVGASTTDAVAARATTVSPAACTSALMSPDLASPRPAGDTITFTASSTTCATPEYKFFLQVPGGSWIARTAFGGASWIWNTTGLTPGVYGVGVWARDTGSTASYEAYWLGTYTLSIVTCTGATIWTGNASPISPGDYVGFVGYANRCPDAQFRFWLKRPGGSWVAMRGWGNSEWTWNTRGYPMGTYEAAVWARQPGSPRSYDAYGSSTFYLGVSASATVTLTPLPLPPGAPGTLVRLDAGYGGPQAQYRFWIKTPSAGWKVLRAYSSSPTAYWDTTGLPVGTYQLGVWARLLPLYPWSGAYNAYAIITYSLTFGPCTGTTLTTDLTSPQATGAQITLTAAATYPDCDQPSYEFWLFPSAAIGWVVLQPYDATDTFALDTTGAPDGPIRIGVWARQTGSTAGYDTYAIVTFWIGS